jgi:hypothetical protein
MSYKRLAKALLDFGFRGEEKIRYNIYHLADAILLPRSNDERELLIASAKGKFGKLNYAPHQHVVTTIRSMINLAKLTDRKITLKFNDVLLVAKPDSKQKTLSDNYWKTRRRKVR